MKIKDKQSGTFLERAELHLDGRDDVENLKRALETHSRHATDEAATFVIPIPLPSERPDRA
jgi:hypothetical protein